MVLATALDVLLANSRGGLVVCRVGAAAFFLGIGCGGLVALLATHFPAPTPR